MKRTTMLVVGILVMSLTALATDLPEAADGSVALAPGDRAAGSSYEAPSPVQMPDNYGTSDWIVMNISAAALQPVRDGQMLSYDGGYYARYAGDPWFDAEVHLPNGALLYGYTAYYRDDDGANDFRFIIWRDEMSYPPNAGNTVYLASHNSSGTPGYSGAYRVLDTGTEVVKNWQAGTFGAPYFYRIRIRLMSDLIRFAGVTLWYKLQVSPAPAVATFNDVPVGAFAYQHIEALVASGITAGCGGGNYCPNAYLTRAQMAVFLAKALGLHWDAYAIQ